MRRLRATCVLCIAFIAVWADSTALRGAAPRQRPTFRGETRLVVLHATVKDSRGRILSTLDRNAFTVLEDGKTQPISLFRRDDVPVTIGLVIDNSGSMKDIRGNVEAAAMAFVRASNALDDAFVVSFADKVRVDVPLTLDRTALEAGVARVDSIGGTAMRDAVLGAETYMREHATHDRRVLLVITDGDDNASTASYDELRRTAEETDTAVFGIGLFRADAGAVSRGRHELDRLCEITGGAAYYPPVEQIQAVAIEIARQIRNEYMIGYTPLNQALDNSYRSIRLRVAGPNRPTARTREGYWATRGVEGRQ